MKDDNSKRGFASMDPNKQREIARMGGKSVKPENRAYSKNNRLAQEAGRKGGLAAGRYDHGKAKAK